MVGDLPSGSLDSFSINRFCPDVFTLIFLEGFFSLSVWKLFFGFLCYSKERFVSRWNPYCWPQMSLAGQRESVQSFCHVSFSDSCFLSCLRDYSTVVQERSGSEWTVVCFLSCLWTDAAGGECLTVAGRGAPPSLSLSSGQRAPKTETRCFPGPPGWCLCFLNALQKSYQNRSWTRLIFSNVVSYELLRRDLCFWSVN